MLRISWQTLRARRTTLAGAFVAIWLAVTLAYATGLLMTGALSAPGPGRFAAADAVVRADPAVVVGRGEDAERVDVIPAPRLPAETVVACAAVPGVARAIGDVAFPRRCLGRGAGSACAPPGADRLQRPRLAERRADAVPALQRSGAARPRSRSSPTRASACASAAGCGSSRLRGEAHLPGHRRRGARGRGDGGQAAAVLRSAVARRLSGTPGRVNAIGIIAEHGTSPDRAARAAA